MIETRILCTCMCNVYVCVNTYEFRELNVLCLHTNMHAYAYIHKFIIYICICTRVQTHTWRERESKEVCIPLKGFTATVPGHEIRYLVPSAAV